MVESSPAADPYVFRAPLTLCVDIRNPLCWLAIQPAFALCKELGVEPECLPFAGAPLKPPPAALPDDDRGTRHRRLRAEYLARDIQRYAAVQGLEIRDIYRSPDASRFAAGLLWLNENAAHLAAEYLLIAFREYWRGTLDIASRDAIPAVLEALGQGPAGFEAFARQDGPARVAGLRDSLVAAGVFDTPAFVVQDQIFLGRAHLPMVRWLLLGRDGPPPI